MWQKVKTSHLEVRRFRMFFENDRTWCSNTECKYTICDRHQSHIVGKPRFISVANFDGTKECFKTKECPTCVYFVGCEGACVGRACKSYKESKRWIIDHSRTMRFWMPLIVVLSDPTASVVGVHCSIMMTIATATSWNGGHTKSLWNREKKLRG